MNIKRLSFAIAAISVLALASVAQSSNVDDWKLVSYSFARVNNYPVMDKNVTMTIDTVQQRISGNSGCNRFFGAFRFEDSGRLAVGPFAGTLMACPRIDERFEQAFRETLASVDSFSFETGFLTLTDRRTGHFLKFQRVLKPELYTWYVNKELEDCTGVVKTKCMQIKEAKDGAWQNFFGPIDGFTFKKGRYYLIEVERTKKSNPAADASAYSHKLIRVIKEAKKEAELSSQ